MRNIVWVGVLALAACQTDDDTAFSFKSGDILLPPGTEAIYCYYFHTPNTAPVAINKWVTDMVTPGSHHMIFFIGGAEHADGLDTTNSCGLDSKRTWIFAAQITHSEQNLPPDDGEGKPLAQLIQPGTLGVFQMHFINTSDEALTVNVGLAAFGLAQGTAYTQTDTFITYNADIAIPPGATNMPVTASCDPPVGAKYWNISTHAHKQAIETQVDDGATLLFKSNDWQHPGERLFDAAPFFSFSGKLTWTCHYDNTGSNANKVLEDGESADTDEMCMSLNYYFPSTGPKYCEYENGLCDCL